MLIQTIDIPRLLRFEESRLSEAWIVKDCRDKEVLTVHSFGNFSSAPLKDMHDYVSFTF